MFIFICCQVRCSSLKEAHHMETIHCVTLVHGLLLLKVKLLIKVSLLVWHSHSPGSGKKRWWVMMWLTQPHIVSVLFSTNTHYCCMLKFSMFHTFHRDFPQMFVDLNDRFAGNFVAINCCYKDWDKLKIIG